MSFPDLRGSLLLVQVIIHSGGCLLSVHQAWVFLLLSVMCAGGFLYHGGKFVCLSTQAVWYSSRVAGSHRSCQQFKRRSFMPLQWSLALPPHLRTSFSWFLLRIGLCPGSSSRLCWGKWWLFAQFVGSWRLRACGGSWVFDRHILTLGLRSHPNIT